MIEREHNNMNDMNTGTQHKSARGFTVVEMIVTVGILVVVSAGIATIFSSIGETVSKGRKLSELNRFAARMERVMRDDFESMTRDGFLVIVNKNANFGQDVQLYRGEKADIDVDLFPGFSDTFSSVNQGGRIRRSDEIMFFTKGDYETARRAISSDMIATSQEAAIYYGHGQKRRPQITASDPSPGSTDNLFFNPQPWDNNFDSMIDTRLGVQTLGQINPNEFARDWSLLRHVTLLVNPIGSGQQVPSELYGLDQTDVADRPYLLDSPRQVSLQPAGRSIFTSLSGSSGSEFHRWLHDLSWTGPVPFDPYPHYRSSGLVDIVTEDLATIRNTLQALPISAAPTDYFNYSPSAPQPGGLVPVIVNRDDFNDMYWGDLVNSPKPHDSLSLDLGKQSNSGGWSAFNATHATRIRQWMIDALPSRWDLSTNPPEFIGGVRYEDIPTRIMYPERGSTQDPFPGGDQGDIARAYAEANQEMLGASVFVPRCTEFVVEWSYGFVNQNLNAGQNGFKELIWYGLDRYTDSNNDGKIDRADKRAAFPYSMRLPGQAGDDPVTMGKRSQGVNGDLVVGFDRPSVGGGAAPLSPDQVEIATFGFSTDPGEVGAIWRWPRFVRVTMTLGDPTDREIEETYQVVFELPELD